jgi:hypothetical protein
MIIDKKLWKTVETPDKIQLLAQYISELQKYDLITSRQYLQQMKLVISIINDLYTQLVPFVEINDVLGVEHLNHKLPIETQYFTSPSVSPSMRESALERSKCYCIYQGVF